VGALPTSHSVFLYNEGMSWHSKKSQQQYHRQDQHEESHYWITLFEDETYSSPMGWWFDDDEDSWYYTQMPGYVHNMEELHCMRLLTLLRSLRIKTAHEEAKDRNW